MTSSLLVISLNSGNYLATHSDNSNYYAQLVNGTNGVLLSNATQWFINSTQGTLNAMLQLANNNIVMMAYHSTGSGGYYVQLINANGTLLNNPIICNVDLIPTITAIDNNYVVTYGYNQSFNAAQFVNSADGNLIGSPILAPAGVTPTVMVLVMGILLSIMAVIFRCLMRLTILRLAIPCK